MKRVGENKVDIQAAYRRALSRAYQITVIATPLSCHGTALNSCGG
uniref:Uncharacterized protein n=1 Tax=Anguilla anguilla TaxID=7936 RepID=A0A0E9S7A1_ANGAN